MSNKTQLITKSLLVKGIIEKLSLAHLEPFVNTHTPLNLSTKNKQIKTV